MSGEIFDVAIIGGGPAGSTAAYCLARSGAKVLIIEKFSQPRYKTCGGGLIGKSLQSLVIHLDTVVQRNCHQVGLYLHDIGLHFSTVRNEPLISMTMRGEFDYKLLAAAKEAGSQVFTECEVSEIHPEHRSVRLNTTVGTISAKFVVGADGVTGTTARKVGWNDTRGFIPALEFEVYAGEDIMAKYTSSARFDVGFVPYGYGWVFPKKEHLSVGVLTTRMHSSNLNKSMERYFKYLGIGDNVQVEKHGFMIPSRPRKDGFVKNRVLLIGDAAGFADPVTGEGISFALSSGELAAKALIEAGFDEDHTRICYQHALEHTLLPEIRYGRIIAKVFYDCPKLRSWLFLNHGQQLTESITDVMMGEKTYRDIFHNYRNYFKLFHVG